MERPHTFSRGGLIEAGRHGLVAALSVAALGPAVAQANPVATPDQQSIGLSGTGFEDATTTPVNNPGWNQLVKRASWFRVGVSPNKDPNVIRAKLAPYILASQAYLGWQPGAGPIPVFVSIDVNNQDVTDISGQDSCNPYLPGTATPNSSFDVDTCSKTTLKAVRMTMSAIASEGQFMAVSATNEPELPDGSILKSTNTNIAGTKLAVQIYRQVDKQAKRLGEPLVIPTEFAYGTDQYARDFMRELRSELGKGHKRDPKAWGDHTYDVVTCAQDPANNNVVKFVRELKHFGFLHAAEWTSGGSGLWIPESGDREVSGFTCQNARELANGGHADTSTLTATDVNDMEQAQEASEEAFENQGEGIAYLPLVVRKAWFLYKATKNCLSGGNWDASPWAPDGQPRPVLYKLIGARTPSFLKHPRNKAQLRADIKIMLSPFNWRLNGTSTPNLGTCQYGNPELLPK